MDEQRARAVVVRDLPREPDLVRPTVHDVIFNPGAPDRKRGLRLVAEVTDWGREVAV